MQKSHKKSIIVAAIVAILSALILGGCAFKKPSGNDDPCANGHKYSEGWAYDSLSHWHESICEHKGLKTPEEQHDYTVDGVIGSTCKVCGYTREGFGVSFTVAPDGKTCIAKKNGQASGLKEIIIPSQYRGATVIEIDNFGFDELPALERIVIPDTVRRIGRFAFSGCSNLVDVNIPSGVTEIQSHVFERCEALSAIELPSGVEEIGEYAFSVCSALTSFTLPASVKYIRDHAFSSCYRLAEVYNFTDFDIECGVDGFGDVALYARVVHTSDVPSNIRETADGYTYYSDDGQAALLMYSGRAETLKLPQTLGGKNYDISARAFYENASIENIEIAGGINAIGAEAFARCGELTSVTLDGVTELGSSAFANCEKLWNIDLPETLRTIGASAFYGCGEMTEINVPSGVERIGTGAFGGCKKLVSLVVPFVGLERTTDGKYDFDRVFGVIFGYGVYDHATSGGVLQYSRKVGIKTEYYIYRIPASLKSVTVTGECVIPQNAFKRCDMLDSFSAPNSVVSDGALFECYNISALSLSPSAHIGAAFGTEEFYGATAVTVGGKTYYVPTALASVRASGDKLPNNAFTGMTGLTSVELDESMTEIGNYAFSGCSNISSLSIPVGVTKIGYNAFQGCEKLEDIDISHVTSLTGSMFEGCAALRSVELSSAIASVPSRAFYGCASLASLDIGGATSIGDNAFYGCKSLVEFVMPRRLATVGRSAFVGCSGLTAVDIPSTVTSIGDNAFNGCASVASITLPFIGADLDNLSMTYPYSFGYIFGSAPYDGGVATKQNYSALSATTYYLPQKLKSVTVTGGGLGFGAFSGCSGLTSITLPGTVDEAPNYAFDGCSALRTLSGASDFKKLGDRAFYGCGELQDLCVARDATDIGEYALYGCGALGFNEYENGLYIGDEQSKYTVFCGVKDKTVTALAINPAARFITEYAISDCASLNTPVAIPSGVTRLRARTFSKCPALTELVIPDTVENIAVGAVYGCVGLTRITLPFPGESAEAEYAALGCVFGTDIYSGSEAVDQKYKDGTMSTMRFYIPSALRAVTVNGGAIGRGAFHNCKMLTSVTLPSGITAVGESAFEGCTGIAALTLPATVKAIGDRAFYGCTSLSTLDGKDGVTSIGNSAFCSTGFTSFAVPSGVKTLAYNLFAECKNLETADISSVTTIGSGAFRNCAKLKEIDIPAAVEEIDEQCFAGCSSLERVTFAADSALKLISFNAFDGCVKLGNVDLPQSVTTVGAEAFKDCKTLTSATIGENARFVGLGAFGGCSSLFEITLPFVGASRDETEAYKKVFGYIFGYTSGTDKNSCPSNATWQYTNTVSSEHYFYYIPKSLKKVNFTGDRLPSYAFYNCSMLTGIDLGGKTEEIGDNAFGVCTGLTSISIPSSVKSIGQYAFTGSANISEASFENTVGWFYAPDAQAASGTPVTVTDPATNAEWLTGKKGQIDGKYWKRK